MKSSRWFLLQVTLAFLMVSSASALANEDESSWRGRDEALRTCDSIDIHTHRRQCREEVAKGFYFEDVASKACATVRTSFRVTDCIVAIRDKRFSDQEVGSCWKESFEHEKIDCLKALGRTAAPHRQVRRKLQEALRAMDAYDWYRARAIVQELIDSLAGEPGDQRP